MIQWLQAHDALAQDEKFGSKHKDGQAVNKPPIAPVPGASSGLLGHLHACGEHIH